MPRCWSQSRSRSRVLAILGDLALNPGDNDARASSPDHYARTCRIGSPRRSRRKSSALLWSRWSRPSENTSVLKSDPGNERRGLFRDGEVLEFPATLYRPDYDGAVAAATLPTGAVGWGQRPMTPRAVSGRLAPLSQIRARVVGFKARLAGRVRPGPEDARDQAEHLRELTRGGGGRMARPL